MRQTIASLHRKIKVAGDLQIVVRTMKAMAASSIGQYEKSNLSLLEYYRTIELGLGVCLRKITHESEIQIPIKSKREATSEKASVVVFGSDQGLVGQFNDVIARHAVHLLSMLPGDHRIWAVGERVCTHLEEGGLVLEG